MHDARPCDGLENAAQAEGQGVAATRAALVNVAAGSAPGPGGVERDPSYRSRDAEAPIKPGSRVIAVFSVIQQGQHSDVAFKAQLRRRADGAVHFAVERPDTGLQIVRREIDPRRNEFSGQPGLDLGV